MKLFVSYSQDDMIICKQIVQRLEREHDVFYDQKIDVSEIWADVLEEQLSACEGFIFLMTRSSLESQPCTDEIALALSLNKRIFPLKLSRNVTTPASLKHIHYINFERGMDDFERLTIALHKAELAMMRKKQSGHNN